MYTLYTHEHCKKIMFIPSNWQQWSKIVEYWALSSIIDEWSQFKCSYEFQFSYSHNHTDSLVLQARPLKILGHCWYELSLLPQAVLKHVVSRDFILKKSVHRTSPVSYQEQRNLCYIISHQNVHVILHYFKKGNFSMWITSESYVDHIWIILPIEG